MDIMWDIVQCLKLCFLPLSLPPSPRKHGLCYSILHADHPRLFSHLCDCIDVCSDGDLVDCVVQAVGTAHQVQASKLSEAFGMPRLTLTSIRYNFTLFADCRTQF